MRYSDLKSINFLVDFADSDSAGAASIAALLQAVQCAIK